MSVEDILHGKEAFLLIQDEAGESTVSFDSMTPDMRNEMVKVTDITSLGWDNYIPGVFNAKLTVSGPYTLGELQLGLGASVTVTVGYTENVALMFAGLVEGITPDIKVEDAQRLKIDIQVINTFIAVYGGLNTSTDSVAFDLNNGPSGFGLDTSPSGIY